MNWGIYDVSGNVWEWCFDQWEFAGTSRVFRGGGWDNLAISAQVSYRDYYVPSYTTSFIGFRVVRSSAP